MSGKPIKMDMIPSFFTLGNLFFGFLSLLWTMNGGYKMAAGFILLSVLMDSMDGKVARKLSVSSDFGKELDSLCDVVSFGVAPAILTYQLVLATHMGVWGMLLAAAFALCGAVRLARFNVLNISTHFLGVPITFAGGLMALMVLFYRNLPWLVFPVALAVLAVLMVSTFKVPKLGK
ncbi:CDP-diacylglycerol--serine O-phosphatidyltransferase [Desulfitobacterium sp. LBE]|uniref:CDP-diacylglycerol--serine O-phosphatidyltransferase n=5 Tax=root TaxID=1 RepID=Q24WD2_DESHY|nr:MULTISPECIES: CDP-diacylglycerol--serine O-phosphatidyltransferase [Desulfitobacterium]ACL21051.1 CDP-diacylglycerol/serine O-phosphatidyltransferase [Desulfitobacterium hafniense DCB-2]KTE91318.1 CDP-diacylglycerol--serine O-phosphatidyltransferase [Desulfitobacterium hafniense]MEA5025871.1 CDP-diacylglycerol--serine O-phosphatidyltransferase [Desulfitobacterium hafniense]TWH56130.1 CDP-diacylglycerol--serine O-phosphatidyltransferase [Desulfitobacterium sp. LBE]CDX01942.1 CDP-diacylglycer